MPPALLAGAGVDTMGHEHAAGAAGTSMLKGFERLSTVDLPITIERASRCLFLSLDAQDGGARSETLLAEMSQRAALRAARRRVAAGHPLGHLPPGIAKPIEKASYEAGANTDGGGLQTVGYLVGGRLRPPHVLTHGVPCSPIFESVLDLLEHIRVLCCRLLPSAACFADAMCGGLSGQWLDLAHASLDGVRIASKDVGDGADPALAECDRCDGRQAAAILFAEALVVLPHACFDCWRGGFLKGKHQDASSISPALQGRR
jgi:hypothetical protein